MAERTLRERCIEALYCGYFGADCLDHMDDQDRQEWGDVLDAVLGVLTEHADEWIGDVGVMEWETWTERAIVLGLLAVLGAAVQVSDD